MKLYLNDCRNVYEKSIASLQLTAWTSKTICVNFKQSSNTTRLLFIATPVGPSWVTDTRLGGCGGGFLSEIKARCHSSLLNRQHVHVYD